MGIVRDSEDSKSCTIRKAHYETTMANADPKNTKGTSKLRRNVLSSWLTKLRTGLDGSKKNPWEDYRGFIQFAPGTTL